MTARGPGRLLGRARGRAPARMLGRCTAVLACVVAAGGCLVGLDLRAEPSGAPQVGQCYDTPDAVLPDPHDPTPPVDCSEPHALETYAVLHAERRLDQQAIDALAQRCVGRVEDYLGAAFAETAISIYYFAPTQEQRADGARWVRCDAGVLADTRGSSTRDVTGSLRGALADGVPLAYRRCLGAPPQPLSSQQLVPCVRPHVAQLMPEAIDLGGADQPYPGIDALTDRANRKCAPIVQAALDDAGRSLVIVPTEQLWAAGSTTAQCWALAQPGERLNDSEAQPA